jgi:mono/diheme cytochrome c family protein
MEHWMTRVASTVAKLVALALLTAGCAVPPGAGAAGVADPDLGDAVAATFQARCTGCHNADAPAAGLSLVEGRMERSLVNVWSHVNDQYFLVKPGDPENSFLIKVIRGESEARGAHMPPNGRLSGAEIDLVSRWIRSLEVRPSAGSGGVEES